MPIERESITEILERLFKTRIDQRGRIYIPQNLRKRLSIKLGERLYGKIENDHFSIYTVRAFNKLQSEIMVERKSDVQESEVSACDGGVKSTSG